jgi:hypothetical protein
METAASANGQARQEQAGSSEGIASLLALARQQINEGNPSLALQAVSNTGNRFLLFSMGVRFGCSILRAC